MRLVELVRRSSLCCGCGVCCIVCPSRAIDMRMSINGLYEPFVDLTKCKHCGLCDKVCPSLFVSKKLSADGLGAFIRCYVGYSTETNVRWSASSGGLTTTMLHFLFDKGFIDAAVVVKDNPNDPLRPSMTLARSKEELESAMGSRYCPVRPSFGLKDLLKVGKGIAIVGLPCHIWGFRSLERVCRELGRRIFVRLGLFCGKCPNLYATVYFLRKVAAVDVDDVVKISYRGRGWPGKVTVVTKRGKEITFDLSDWVDFSYYPHFIPIRCAFCYDVTNQLADVSLGDAWGLAHDKVGSSVVITRTDVGERVVRWLREEGKAFLRDVAPEDITRGQSLDVKVRRSLIRAHVWWRVFRQPAPRTPLPPKGCSMREWVLGLGYCAWLYMARKPLVRRVLCELTPQLSKLVRLSRRRR